MKTGHQDGTTEPTSQAKLWGFGLGNRWGRVSFVGWLDNLRNILEKQK